MATRSIELNGLNDRMSVINDNLNRALDHLHTSSADLIFCNPPYFKVDSDESHLNESKHYTLARHELTTNLDEIFSVSKKLLTKLSDDVKFFISTSFWVYLLTNFQ